VKKLLYIALSTLFFAACNNKPADNTPVASADTMNHTGPDNMSSSKPSASPADSAFLVTAYQIGTFEVEIGKLALKNSQDAQVKEFANMMITDHTAMSKEVEGLAAQKGVMLPAALGDDLKKKCDKLYSLTGKEFDKDYASINVKGHAEAIVLFTKTSQDKNCSPEVQQLASNALPKLKVHKEHADMLKVHEKM
jgi:putative membrane protein